jgi:tetratricopeptide (TPR) repeat protein/outer membrane biosynthesis protein TonB
MRDVIEKYPVSPQVNQAYYYIGLGHFQQGHYSRAIAALERVGTALPPPEGPDKAGPTAEVLEAGKRLFVRVEDADLAALEPGKTVSVKVESASGDVEAVECTPIGRNVRVVIGSIPTALGKPKPNNGRLEVRGGDKVKVTYRDIHTAKGDKEELRIKEIDVVGTATAAMMDGAFAETLQGVVLGRAINLQVVDADGDLTDGADIVKATIEVYREKTPEELAAEAIAPGAAPATPAKADPTKLERFKKIDKVDVILTEVKIARAAPEKVAIPINPLETPKELDPKKDAEPKKDGEPKKEQEPKKEEPKKEEPKKEPTPVETPKPIEDDGTIHSGTFRASVPLEKNEVANPGDQALQAQPNDLIVLTYIDAKNSTGEPRTVVFKARAVEGSLGSVKVSQTQISDQELRVRTQLKTASALTNIGNRYKEFGLKQQADQKYQQAMTLSEEIVNDASKLGGRTLEETYVQLWKIYFEMDKLELAAAMSQRLQREFPNSEFVDAALISLAQVARKQGQFQRTIGIYNSVLRLEKSPLRGEAQFGIAECYEDMAKAAEGASASQLFDQSFQEYKKVFDQYPDSGRVGEAVAKMANYYYVQKDYARAIDVFETVLRTHPDAKFLDVILFNYGRCLYRLEKKAEARKQFDQLIGDFPESPLAADAKKISEALRKGGN